MCSLFRAGCRVCAGLTRQPALLDKKSLKSRNFAAVAGVPNSVDGKLSMIFAKIAFWEIVSAKINLGLEWC